MKGYIYCFKSESEEYKINGIGDDFIEELYEYCLSNNIKLEFVKRVHNYMYKIDVINNLLLKNGNLSLNDIKLYFELMDGEYLEMDNSDEYSSSSDGSSDESSNNEPYADDSSDDNSKTEYSSSSEDENKTASKKNNKIRIEEYDSDDSSN